MLESTFAAEEGVTAAGKAAGRGSEKMVVSGNHVGGPVPTTCHVKCCSTKQLPFNLVRLEASSVGSLLPYPRHVVLQFLALLRR